MSVTRGIKAALAVVGVGWIAVTFLGTILTSDPQWSLQVFYGIIGQRGVLFLAIYFALLLVLAPFGLLSLLRILGGPIHNGVLLGLCGGLIVSLYVDFLQLALPYVGDHVNVPGLPLAMVLGGDDRLARIWSRAFGINALAYGVIGALVGFIIIAKVHRTPDGTSAPELDARQRITRLAPRAAIVTAFLTLVITGWCLRNQGPGRPALDAFLAPFGLVPGIRYEPGLTYSGAKDLNLKLDLCMPDKSDGRLPAVVCIHGGGWHGGRREEYTPLIVQLAKRGYLAVTISYRLAPAHRFPDQIEDLKCAVRWLRANARQYGIDPQRIGAVGWSAGGHLACLLGTSGAADEPRGAEAAGAFSSAVQAVVSFSGLTDLTADYWNVIPVALQGLMGATFSEKPEAYRRASAISYVDGGDPPFLLLHGGADGVVPLDQSRRLLRALESAGVEASLNVFPRARHRWYGAAARESFEMVFGFLDQHLKGKRVGP